MNLSTNVSWKFGLILPLLTCVCCNLFGSDNAPLTQPWIVTNGVGAVTPPGGYFREYDLTPRYSPEVATSDAINSDVSRLFLRLHEPSVTLPHVEFSYTKRIVVSYDFRALGTNEFPKTDQEIRAAWTNNRTLLKVTYFRGLLVYDTAGSSSNEWATIFSSEDHSRIVCVHDSGQIHISEDTGATWKTISRPADYEFTLATTAKGSVLVALVHLTQKAIPVKMEEQNWYCAASGGDGSQLVLTGGPSQSAPVLTITRSGTDNVITWPASFIGFTLQQSDVLPATNWITVSNQAVTIDTKNEVVLPALDGHSFFRLTTH